MTDGQFRQIAFALGDIVGSRVEKQLRKTNESQTMKKLTTRGKLTSKQQAWLLDNCKIKTTNERIAYRSVAVNGAP